MDDEEMDLPELPPLNDDAIGTLFVDDNGVVWVCEIIEGLDQLGWRSIGRKDS